MAQGLNNLIQKYYKRNGDILNCCSCEIKSSILGCQNNDKDILEQEARIKIYELLENHKLA